MDRKPLLFFGEALMDCQCDTEGNTLQALPGGAPLNVAVGVRRLDLPASFAGVLGDDDFGRELASVMDQEKIGRDWVKIPQGTTTLRAQVVLSCGTPAFRFFQGTSGRAWSEGFTDLDPLDFSLFHCGGVLLTSEPAAAVQENLANRFYDAGIPVSFDPNIRPDLIGDAEAYRERILIAMTRPQLVKLSDADLNWILPGVELNRAFEILWSLRKGAMTVLTLGQSGSLLASGHRCLRARAYSVRAVDTTGCGDGYMAGLLRGLMTLTGRDWSELTDEELEWVAQGASAVAARVAEKFGAIPAMPWLSQIYDIRG